MGTKRHFSVEEKLAVVLEGLKGVPVRELCQKYGLRENLYYRWREEALEGLKQGLADKRKKGYRDSSGEVERNRLLKIIGEQQVVLDMQKKISETLSGTGKNGNW